MLGKAGTKKPRTGKGARLWGQARTALVSLPFCLIGAAVTLITFRAVQRCQAVWLPARRAGEIARIAPCLGMERAIPARVGEAFAALRPFFLVVGLAVVHASFPRHCARGRCP